MTEEKIKKANEIIYELLTKNWSITDDNDLFKQYQDDLELQKLTQEAAEGLQCRLLKVSNRLYLLPNAGNAVFAKTNSDIKNELRFLKPTDKDIGVGFNLQMFIIATFFKLVDDDEDDSIQFYQIGELDEKVNERLKRACQSKNPEAEYDYPALKAFFDSMTTQSEEETNNKEANKRKMYEKIFDFLKKYGLAKVDWNDKHYFDTQIYPQQRLKDLLKHDLSTQVAMENYIQSHDYYIQSDVY